MRCPACGLDKSLNDFSKNRSTKTGRQVYCKPCYNRKISDAADRLYGGHRNFLLMRRYGINETELNRLLEKQHGLCAICREQPAEHVDHCHHSGKVRGLLCFNCNGALGRFEDDPEILERAIEYLVAHGRD